MASERALSFNLHWYIYLSSFLLCFQTNETATIKKLVWCRFLDPIIFGKYPSEMQNILGTILPKFSITEMLKLQRAVDFIGINYYTGAYVKDCIFSKCESGEGVTRTEGLYLRTKEKNGVPIGKSVSSLNSSIMFLIISRTYQLIISLISSFLSNSKEFSIMQSSIGWSIYPQGMEKMITHVKDRYNNIPMFITENGNKTKMYCLDLI